MYQDEVPTSTQNCRSCRHHSLKREERVLTRDEVVASGEYSSEDVDFINDVMAQHPVHDGSPEDIARYGPRTHDETFSCTKQGMVVIGSDDNAGVGCTLWEEGKRGGRELPPHLLARMAELEAKGG